MAAQRREWRSDLRAKHADTIRPVASLQEFFKDSVADAMEKQGVAADDHTAHYVVNLLTLFARSEKLYDRNTEGPAWQPLALQLAEAASATDTQTRNVVLQRVGDTSLFVAGFFQDGFARKLVDVDYYIEIGGAAYGSLSENVRGTIRGRALGGVFAELAEIRDSGRAADALDILRLYEVWLKTRSVRAARLLRSQGIEPSTSLDAATRH